MTVTYTAEVATCRGFGCFLKLLFRWRGSIYKLVWLDLLSFLLLYYILNILYRFVLDVEAKQIFAMIVQYCATYTDLIPLSFVLGFYVSIVMTRWWNQYVSIPWPDPIAVFVSANVHGQDERGRLMRRTIMRYVCLCLTMVLTMISPRVKKRFPTLEHLVEAGLLLENERVIMQDLNNKFPRHSKHWLPIVWAASIVTRARKEGRIRDDFAVKTVIDELNKFRGQCGLLISYDTISVPLVYTQVVTLAVYSYFITSVMGRQYVDDSKVAGVINQIDQYFPLFTTLQFFFYMGWLKVAESLINPFGEDDDDFEVNWIVDRNLQVAYMIVDEMHHDHPELIKDQYWDQVFPAELPYTVAAEQFREQHPEPSTANIEVPKNESEMVTIAPSGIRLDELDNHTVSYKFPDSAAEDGNEDAMSGIHFTAGSVKRGSIRSNHERHMSGGSQSSILSNGGSIPRVNSVTSVLKRLFSREDRPGTAGSQTDGTVLTRLPGSASTASMQGKFVGGGSMRIADQIIEEVDEQLTITSMANRNDTLRPNIKDLFPDTIGPPPPSDPVPVPNSGNYDYNRTHSEIGQNTVPLFPRGGVEALLSSSAPVPTHLGPLQPLSPSKSAAALPRERYDSGGPTPSAAGSFIVGGLPEEDTISMESDGSDSTDDEFKKLKLSREKERRQRQIQQIARSISAQQGANELQLMDNESILMDVLGSIKNVNQGGLLSTRSSMYGGEGDGDKL